MSLSVALPSPDAPLRVRTQPAGSLSVRLTQGLGVLATEAQAIAGVDGARVMTPETTKAAIREGEFFTHAYGGAARTFTSKSSEWLSPEDKLPAAGDGVTDATAAIRAALDENVAVRLTPGRTYRVNNLEVGDGDYIWSDPLASNIQGPTGGTTFLISGGPRLEGFNSVGAPEYHFKHDATSGGLNGLILRGVKCELGTFGFYTFGYGQLNTNITVDDCYFESVANPILNEHVSDFTYTKNRFNGAGGSNILFRMAQRGVIRGNAMQGGTTGVTCLGSVSNSGALAGTFEQLLIDANRIRGISEESISFDCSGSSASDVLARERAAVASKSSDSDFYYITATTPAGSWSGSTGTFSGYYMCFFSGAAAGATCKVYYNTLGVFAFARGTVTSGSQQMTAAQFAAITTGDEFVIGLPFRNNTVSNNIIEATTGADHYAIGILLYGLAFKNKAFGNMVRMQRTLASDLAYGMQISSLSAIDGAGSKVSGSGDQRAAPCVANVFSMNDIEGADLVLNYNDFSAGTTHYISLGNRTALNTVSGGARICVSNEDLGDDDVVVS